MADLVSEHLELCLRLDRGEVSEAEFEAARAALIGVEPVQGPLSTPSIGSTTLLFQHLDLCLRLDRGEMTESEFEAARAALLNPMACAQRFRDPRWVGRDRA